MAQSETSEDAEKARRRAVQTAREVGQNMATRAALERLERRIARVVAEKRAFG